MNIPHKHAAVIKAWADGAIVQINYRDPDSNWYDIKQPTWDIKHGYRIKPEKKEGWLNIYSNGSGNLHESRVPADLHAAASRIACIKITYEEGEGLS